jgi:uncharacterized protein (UPF0147 family)
MAANNEAFNAVVVLLWHILQMSSVARAARAVVVESSVSHSTALRELVL